LQKHPADLRFAVLPQTPKPLINKKCYNN